MTSQPILKVENLALTLEGKTIIKNVSFEINKEEALAVIGPNGSGKSMMLKTLLGLYTPTNGTITWAPNTKIGYLPQRFHVDYYLPLTVHEFLSLKPQAEYSQTEIIKSVHLAPKILSTTLAHLSGGELQKVLLAWALMNKPHILLFDEPTENVDVVSQESIYKLLHNLQDTLGIAMIIVSHDLNIVYRYANNVLCLNEKMLCYGEPQTELTDTKLAELYGDHAFFHHHHYDKNTNS